MVAVEKRNGRKGRAPAEKAGSNDLPEVNESPAANGPRVAETEVAATAQRRRFTAEYKRRIVREAERCTQPGTIGALLRREGLYASHLTTWRTARERGELAGLAPKRRGPKATPPDPRDQQLAAQAREIVRWQQRAERAEALVALQKQVAALLGSPPLESAQ